jgi:hypothetical protein
LLLRVHRPALPRNPLDEAIGEFTLALLSRVGSDSIVIEGIGMRNYKLMAFLLFAIASFSPLQAQSPVPRMTTVEPASGTIGDVLTATGDNLDRDSVAALYLTDGKSDVKVVITEQTATSIKFRIPPEAKTGRCVLMVLTKGKDPKLIEEPVKVTVEASRAGSTT